jgi:pyruvate/2-oxoglutarate dehydrogenase complex dihydrolipoamide acyltransferase (E2) component
MRIEVVLPKWGMTMQEGTIASWTVAEGAVVREGDPIAIVETEKVETELPAPESGTLVEIVVDEGETVEVGSLIAWLETS